jgi:hypothetical protein
MLLTGAEMYPDSDKVVGTVAILTVTLEAITVVPSHNLQ